MNSTKIEDIVDLKSKLIPLTKGPLFIKKETTNSKTCSIHCWHCCILLNMEELISISLNNSNNSNNLNNNVKSTSGSFCSFNCAKIFIIENFELFQESSLLNLETLFKEVTKTENILYPAVPKELLQSFGGILSESQFQLLPPNLKIERVHHFRSF